MSVPVHACVPAYVRMYIRSLLCIHHGNKYVCVHFKLSKVTVFHFPVPFHFNFESIISLYLVILFLVEYNVLSNIHPSLASLGSFNSV